jgi:hypothetical protein
MEIKNKITPGVPMAFSLFATFPTGKTDFKTGHPEMQGIIQTGMELRDYFAAQALQVAGCNLHVMVMNDPTILEVPIYHEIAKAAYQMADAMIEARIAGPMTSDKG